MDMPIYILHIKKCIRDPAWNMTTSNLYYFHARFRYQPGAGEQMKRKLVCEEEINRLIFFAY